MVYYYSPNQVVIWEICNIFRQNVIRRKVIRRKIVRLNVIRRNIIRRNVIRRNIIRRIIVRPIIIRRIATFPKYFQRPVYSGQILDHKDIYKLYMIFYKIFAYSYLQYLQILLEFATKRLPSPFYRGFSMNCL